ncbi:Protein ZBED8 [Chionoecetes opilio]|uniref:Protein ZBED8 n=1 Tax=Chionoecetes opilio TaxID=41210 RepID=A0A8J4Y5G4_CHIOP|nr:Protein ZBED8 [Chionoecetes opilio]
MSTKRRKWSETCVAFGFTKIVDKDGAEKAQCMQCHTILENASLKPSLLKAHQEQAHPGKVETLPSLQMKRARYDQKGTLPAFAFTPAERPLLQATYEVALQIAKEQVAHNLAEKVIKPCALRMAELVVGEEAAKQIKHIPLSNDVIRSRINEMSSDVLDQIVSDIYDSPCPISLQLDESTDVANASQLLVFVRFVKQESYVYEFLFCNELPLKTRAVDVF